MRHQAFVVLMKVAIVFCICRPVIAQTAGSEHAAVGSKANDSRAIIEHTAQRGERISSSFVDRRDAADAGCAIQGRTI
jgi:hypothetical protein